MAVTQTDNMNNEYILEWPLRRSRKLWRRKKEKVEQNTNLRKIAAPCRFINLRPCIELLSVNSFHVLVSLAAIFPQLVRKNNVG